MDYVNNNTIDGWMSKDELSFLANEASKYETIAELGVYKGKSLCAMASTCKGVLYAIDHWKGSGPLVMKGDEFAIFLDNIRNFGNIRIIRKDTVSATKDVKKVDMVFIDADHSYEGVKTDITNWLPKTNKLICGHDYDEEGCKKAVDELLKIDGLVGSIWYKYL